MGCRIPVRRNSLFGSGLRRMVFSFVAVASVVISVALVSAVAGDSVSLSLMTLFLM